MLFPLLMLATPRIGPPPNVCAPRLELEMEFEDEDPAEDDPLESEFPVAPELADEELSEDEPADVAFPALPLAAF
jgi:hypothetical protein